MTETPQRVFDGHNDVLSGLARRGDLTGEGFFEGGVLSHIDLPRAREGGLGGGFFAIWAPGPDDPAEDVVESDGEVANDGLLDAVPEDHARESLFRQADLANAMDGEAGFRLCLTADDIEQAQREGEVAALLHLEGAEGIGVELAELDRLHALGLRSLGPVWSRPNIFGTGVPFLFDKSPNIGPGLSDHGERLVRRCAELGLIVDLAHMNEAGFWNVARLYDGPLISTHSAAHALCPATRNLTAKQLSAIAERDGVVGLNFHCAFLRSDGRRDSDTSLEVLIRHLDALISVLGEDGVALGSDFDGALMPEALADCSKLPALVEAMARAEFGQPLIEKICWSNWVGLIRRVVG